MEKDLTDSELDLCCQARLEEIGRPMPNLKSPKLAWFMIAFAIGLLIGSQLFIRYVGSNPPKGFYSTSSPVKMIGACDPSHFCMVQTEDGQDYDTCYRPVIGYSAACMNRQ